jgi:hypothetical protein
MTRLLTERSILILVENKFGGEKKAIDINGNMKNADSNLDCQR